jgi:hypothetical protein
MRRNHDCNTPRISLNCTCRLFVTDALTRLLKCLRALKNSHAVALLGGSTRDFDLHRRHPTAPATTTSNAPGTPIQNPAPPKPLKIDGRETPQSAGSRFCAMRPNSLPVCGHCPPIPPSPASRRAGEATPAAGARARGDVDLRQPTISLPAKNWVISTPAVAAASEPCTEFSPIDFAKALRIVPGAALAGSVAPMRSR